MACISCKAKIEGIAERVSGMKDEEERIESLLQRNADEQLAGFDWGQLNAAISSRVDQAEKRRSSGRKYPIVFKIAAGVAAAVVIVVVAVTVRMAKSPDIRPQDSGTARVELIGRRGSASVEIIDSAEDVEARSAQAAWIIISKPERVYADNGINRDTMAMICLF